MQSIRVIIAEADALLQKLYTDLISKEKGFVVLGCVSNKKQLSEKLSTETPDLVLLNFYLDNFDSLKTFDILRKTSSTTEYIIIFDREDAELEREALKHAVFKYFISPFSFESLRQTLNDYRIYHAGVVDNLSFEHQERIGTEKEHYRYWANNKSLALPGLSAERLDDIEGFLKENPDTYSAREVATSLNFSLATARRHLEFLVTVGRIEVKFAYKRTGRPEKRYSTMLV